MRYHYPTRLERRIKRLRNWFDALTLACADSKLFWFSITAFCISTQLIFHPDFVRWLIDAFWWWVNGG